MLDHEKLVVFYLNLFLYFFLRCNQRFPTFLITV
jgi:hypothetical protein